MQQAGQVYHGAERAKEAGRGRGGEKGGRVEKCKSGCNGLN